MLKAKIYKYLQILLFVFSTGAFISTFGDPSVNYNTIWIAMLISSLTIFLLDFHSRSSRHFWANIGSRYSGIIMMLLLTIVISLSSIDVSGSIYRSSILIFQAAVMMLCIHRLGLKESVKNLVIALSFCCLVSLALYGLGVENSIMRGLHDGDLKGVFAHKNSMGRIATILFVASIVSVFFLSKSKFYLFTAFLAITCIYFSSSSTSVIISLIIFLMCISVFSFTNGRISLKYAIFVVLSCGSLLLYYSITSNLENSSDLDLSLTGRVPMWNSVIDFANQKIYTGYGFNIFWKESFEYSNTLFYIHGWLPGQAHNGFIDAYLSFGLIFLAYVTYNIYMISSNLIRNVIKRKDAMLASRWILLVSFIAINLTESSFLVSNPIFFYVLLLASYNSEKK